MGGVSIISGTHFMSALGTFSNLTYVYETTQLLFSFIIQFHLQNYSFLCTISNFFHKFFQSILLINIFDYYVYLVLLMYLYQNYQ